MILTVTFNPAVDQTMRLDGPLRPDAVNRAGDARFDAGGKGVNVSQNLTALGTDTVATGLLGGFTGSFVRSALEEDGVESDFVAVEETTRLNTTVLADGVEYKLNQTGPTVDGSVVDAVLDRVAARDPDRVLVGGSLPPGVGPEAVDRIARAGDWETGVDAGGDLLRSLTADYAFCKPNREELAAATGADVSTVEGCAAAASEFRRSGFERVIASLGGDGALLAGPDGVVFAEALDVDVVDTAGAGDALLSGILAALEDGADDETALRTGVAVAAAAVRRAGTDVPAFDGLPDDRGAVSVKWLRRAEQ